jgi:hypothetical protein
MAHPLESSWWRYLRTVTSMLNRTLVRFQVLTAASTKMAVFWDVAPCSLVDVDRCLRGAYCLHLQGDESLLLLYVIINTDVSTTCIL